MISIIIWIAVIYYSFAFLWSIWAFAVQSTYVKPWSGTKVKFKTMWLNFILFPKCIWLCIKNKTFTPPSALL
jgi:hypothetical protein